MPKSKSKAPKFELPKEITHDVWAESGGSAGIFAKGVRSGKIKIVKESFDD